MVMIGELSQMRDTGLQYLSIRAWVIVVAEFGGRSMVDEQWGIREVISVQVFEVTFVAGGTGAESEQAWVADS